MGKRGPKPKPTALKVLHGTYRPDRAADNEAKPDGPATPPDWLSDEAAEHWRVIVPKLARIGLATNADEQAMGRYCEVLAMWLASRDAVRGLDGSQMYVTTDTGYTTVHPAAAEVRKWSKELLDLEREFGMTPSARSKIEAAVPADAEDEWAKVAAR